MNLQQKQEKARRGLKVVQPKQITAKSNIKALSWTSFLWSTASLMVFSVLPVFLTDELGVHYADLGMIEGVAISSAFASKFFVGILSDYYSTRKPFIMLGTFLSALTKPLFALSQGIGLIFFTRFIDRMSKGIRSAPMDALLGDLAEDTSLGSVYGLRQSFYTLGAVVGALCAIIILKLSDNNYRMVFWLASIPATLALFVVSKNVHPPALQRQETRRGPRGNCAAGSPWKNKEQLVPLTKGSPFKMTPQFWVLLGVTFFLMLARFSEAFLSLKAKQEGWDISLLPLVIIIMDLVHAGVALPSGKLSDTYPSKKLLVYGILVLSIAHLFFTISHGLWFVFIAIIITGIHMGMTQGLLRSLIVKSQSESSKNLLGTAFSIFYIVSGIGILLSNLMAGQLSQIYGLNAAFIGGTVFSLIALSLLYFFYHPTE